MEQFFIILQQLFIFTFFVLIGFLCVKYKIMDQATLNSMSKFIIMITMPAMLICNLLSGPSYIDLLNSLPIFVVYLICFIILYLLNCIVVYFFRFDKKKANIYKALATFSNAGFIGIPLILAVFKQEGGVFSSLCTIVDQIMLWTLGVKLTSNLNNHTLEGLKKFMNPSLIAIAISLFGVVLELRLPRALFYSLSPIGSMTPVLSMIYIGGLFCFSNIKKYFKNLELYVLILFKMIIFPLMIWLILKQTQISENIVRAVVLLFSLPSMTSIAIFAQKYENNPEYAVATVLITSMFSVATVPLVVFLIDKF